MSERNRIKLDDALKALDIPFTAPPFEWATAGQYD
jgi:hypothetical protein